MTAVDAMAIADVIRAHRFAYVDEDELQAGITAALIGVGFTPRREVRLAAGDRIDILVGRVGIEVKVGGSAGALERQLARYAQSGRVDELVAVTSRIRHLNMPAELDGKPLHVVSVGVL